MEKMRFGRTGLMVCRTGFGVLPIQRVSFDEAKKLLQKAYNGGINFFDTARAYSDSEEKIGLALSHVRKDIIIATKSHAVDKKTLLEHLEMSLEKLKTDYIDIYQLHNPETLPDIEDPDSLYAGLIEAKKRGLIRFIGITNHRLKNAIQAADSKHYDTIQFPLSSISSEEDLKLIVKCKENDIGLIAMKALSGGLITNVASAFAFLRQFDNVLPIWGIQREVELDEFLVLEKTPPVLDSEMMEVIKKDRTELAAAFCRGCGYCLPCPADIPIPMAARMSLLLNRAPYQGFLSDEWKQKMELVTNCINCGHCKAHCPYELDTPSLLKAMLSDYQRFYNEHKV